MFMEAGKSSRELAPYSVALFTSRNSGIATDATLCQPEITQM